MLTRDDDDWYITFKLICTDVANGLVDGILYDGRRSFFSPSIYKFCFALILCVRFIIFDEGYLVLVIGFFKRRPFLFWK